MKTPLNSLQLLTSSILRGAAGRALDPEKLIARTTRLDGQLQRLTGLVNNLLDVSRRSAGRLRVEYSDLDLERSVHDMAERLKPNLLAAKCELTMRIEGPLAGRWDRLRVDRVISNLLTNALKYGAGKPIELGARQEAGVAILSVRDHGIGIALADHQRISERFARAVSAEHYGGFGLGLWIAKQFAEAMGGTITVESAPGEGACFTVRLPMQPLVEPLPSEPAAIAAQP